MPQPDQVMPLGLGLAVRLLEAELGKEVHFGPCLQPLLAGADEAVEGFRRPGVLTQLAIGERLVIPGIGPACPCPGGLVEVLPGLGAVAERVVGGSEEVVDLPVLPPSRRGLPVSKRSGYSRQAA